MQYGSQVQARPRLGERTDSANAAFARCRIPPCLEFRKRFSRGFLRAQGIEADPALVAQTLKSSQGQEELIAPKLGGSVKAKYLLVDGRYILWDYAGGKPICAGRFRPRRDYRLQPGTGIG